MRRIGELFQWLEAMGLSEMVSKNHPSCGVFYDHESIGENDDKPSTTRG
jgi:hypothetical protein